MTASESPGRFGIDEALGAAVLENALVLAGPDLNVDFPPGLPHRTVPAAMLVPLAEGARLADRTRPVLAAGADGDIYGPALGDLLHAVRRNVGVTCLVLQNGVTGGGVAAVGPGEYPLKPLALALAAGGTFVAQGVPEEDLGHLTAHALHHPGFALVNIRQDYHPDGVHAIEDEPEYDRFDRRDALQFAAATDRITTGILFREPERASFEETALGQAPLVTTVSTVDWEDWERIIYEGWEEGGPDEPDVDSPDP